MEMTPSAESISNTTVLETQNNSIAIAVIAIFLACGSL